MLTSTLSEAEQEKRFPSLPLNTCLVELGGLEPPSKHRTRKLSTCLVSLRLSGQDCRETGYPELILWVLAEFKGVPLCIRFG